MAYNLARTGDALAFFHAKHAWHELTLLGLFTRNRIAGTVHLLARGRSGRRDRRGA